jgi:hypothetical protein
MNFFHNSRHPERLSPSATWRRIDSLDNVFNSVWPISILAPSVRHHARRRRLQPSRFRKDPEPDDGKFPIAESVNFKGSLEFTLIFCNPSESVENELLKEHPLSVQATAQAQIP